MTNSLVTSLRVKWGYIWRAWPYIAVTVIAAVGIVLIASGEVRNAYEQHLANDYAAVEGTIRESRVQQTSRSGKQRSSRYLVVVDYSYEVNGEPFTGDRIRASGGESFRKSSEARAHAARHFPEGGPVTVYHHPEHPERSLLQPGFGVPEMQNLAAVKGFLTVPLLFWFVAVAVIRSGRRRTKPGRLRFDSRSGMVSGHSPDMEPWLVAGIAAVIANFFVTLFFSLSTHTLPAQIAGEAAGLSIVAIFTVATYRNAKRSDEQS